MRNSHTRPAPFNFLNWTGMGIVFNKRGGVGMGATRPVVIPKQGRAYMQIKTTSFWWPKNLKKKNCESFNSGKLVGSNSSRLVWAIQIIKPNKNGDQPTVEPTRLIDLVQFLKPCVDFVWFKSIFLFYYSILFVSITFIISFIIPFIRLFLSIWWFRINFKLILSNNLNT